MYTLLNSIFPVSLLCTDARFSSPPTCIPRSFLLWELSVLIFIFSRRHCALWNKITFFRFQFFVPAGLSYKFGWPGALLAWPSKTRTQALSGGCCRLAFWPLFIEKEGLPLVLPFGFENTTLYVSRPLHTVHSTIMTVNEDLHTELIYRHTKEMGRSPASQCGLWYLICRVWDQLLMLYYPMTRFDQAKACHLAWGKKRGHPHKHKANANLAHQADVFSRAKLEGSCFEFIYQIQRSRVGNRAKIPSVARLGQEHLVGRTSIMPSACVRRLKSAWGCKSKHQRCFISSLAFHSFTWG